MSRSRAHSVFEEALTQVPAMRRAFVESRCSGDAGLLDEVLSLLAALERAGEFLGHPTAGEPGAVMNGATATGASSLDVPLREGPGTVIGRYKLLQQLGEGGFGVVFLAEQREPVVRKVALKIIKLGMDTSQVVARFEQERQALAIMDHPSIAKVLDGGATESGRPYFVMELVRGDPVTQYCDTNSLSTKGRLDLFMQVCNAVQHAHTKGVIHRDLKPGNVLITVADGRPIPKVIDFGIAKATGARLIERTLFTEHRAFIGTPAYMSPEQAEMSGVDIDTRSDIYSLGVLLYELLTGTTPFDTKSLMEAGLAEIQRIIREVEPEKPSTRLSTRKEALTKVAAQRHAEPGRLASLVRGDLDWIVMKALEKDRTRRYDTAHALAMEVERYLKDEPVLAGPPSRLYRLRKFVRRNRGTVTAAALVAAALLLGLAGTTSGLLWAEERRAEAEAAEGREREQRELAEERERQTAQVSSFQAEMLRDIDVEAMGRRIKERFREQVRATLERQYVGEFPDRRPRTPEEIGTELAAFDQRAAAAPAADVARLVLDEFVLARAAGELEERFADQPLVRAQLHFAIGTTYRGLDLFGAAEAHLRAALEIREREHGSAHPAVGPPLNQLGILLAAQGDHAGAEALFRRKLEIDRNANGQEPRDVARSLNSLANVLCDKGDYPEAEQLAREALEIFSEAYGNQDPQVADSLNAVGKVLIHQREYAAAEPLLREALAIKLLGGEHPDAEADAAIMNSLAFVLMERGDHAAAEALLTDAAETLRKVYGHEHHLVATAFRNLGMLLKRRGDLAGAEPLLRDALAIHRTVQGDAHPDVADDLEALADLLRLKGEYTAASERLREALTIRRETMPDRHARLPWVLHHLADCLRATHEFDEAELAAREAVGIYRASADSSPEQRNEHRHAIDVLAQTLVDAGKPEEAILVRREIVEDCRRLSPRDDLSLANALAALGWLLFHQYEDSEAEAALRECVEVREEALETDSPEYWQVVDAWSMLGGVLAERGAALIQSDARTATSKFAEAELVLLEPGEWLTQNADRIPLQSRAGCLHEALHRIVRLYESWNILAPDTGKAQQAAEWRTELQRYPGPCSFRRRSASR